MLTLLLSPLIISLRLNLSCVRSPRDKLRYYPLIPHVSGKPKVVGSVKINIEIETKTGLLQVNLSRRSSTGTSTSTGSDSTSTSSKEEEEVVVVVIALEDLVVLR